MELPRDARRWLAARGLRVDPRAQRQHFASRNPTLPCRDAEGRRRFVKFAVPGDAAVRDEAARLRALRDVPGVPRVAHASTAALAVEWIDGETLWALRRRPGRGLRYDARIGAELARVQLAGAKRVRRGEVQGDFAEQLLWTSPELFATLGPASLALFREVHANARALDTLWGLLEAERSGAVTLVHGDLRQPNILVGEAGITFVDWEVSGLGDPARDLGMLLAEDVRAWLLPHEERTPPTRAQLERHARAFVGAWESSAEALGFPVDAALRPRVLGWTGESLLRGAYTIAHLEGRIPDGLVEAALGILAEPVESARLLLGERLRSPRAEEQPRSPRAEEQPRSPRAEEQPRSPRAEEQPRSPRAEEQPRSPRAESRGASSLGDREVLDSARTDRGDQRWRSRPEPLDAARTDRGARR